MVEEELYEVELKDGRKVIWTASELKRWKELEKIFSDNWFKGG